MNEVPICPVCGSSISTTYLTPADHALSKEVFTLRKCTTCSLVVTSPRPSEDELPRYYRFNDYISHSGKTTSGFLTILYNIARSFTLKWKRAIIKREFTTGRILDVGCGTGEFLNIMRQSGWEIEGIEPTAVARKKAEGLLNQSVYHSIKDLPTNRFDVITLWHVLEHVYDLNNTLEQLKKRLNPGGLLLIAVPNHQAFDAQKYEADWAGYDVPRHLWHFNTTSMTALLKRNNLTLTRILPMKLDAYYVSLLSEQYISPDKPLKNYLNAFCTGILSNLKARKKLNYSSLIFMAKVNQR
ncbi:MAG: class I SAM-dependent methyltransferase [Cyclobacteriaceae bacterium]